MQMHHRTSHGKGRRNTLALALCLALGMTGTALAGPATATESLPERDSGSLAALIRHAQEAGIEVPADLPKYYERHLANKPLRTAPSPKITRTVTHCGDDGDGSLRAAVAAAQNNDVIDMSGLSCDVTLQSSVVTSANNLTILGNPDTKYGISGGNTVRPLKHEGTGTLTLDGVSVKLGRVDHEGTSAARGGCIFSAGSVTLKNRAEVKYCTAQPGTSTSSLDAFGGAIFSSGNVKLEDGVRIAGNKAIAGSGDAYGGGIFAGGDINLSGALITGNVARTTNGFKAMGGGLFTEEGALGTKYASIEDNRAEDALVTAGGGAWVGSNALTRIKYSTFSGNSADGGAAMVIGKATSSGTSIIQLSTIANNVSKDSTKYGGAVFLGGNATIKNSTISGNSEQNDDDNKYGAGVTLGGTATLTMSSSIVGDNVLVFPDDDLLPSDMDHISGDSGTIAGDHNIIGFSGELDVPADTINSITTAIRLGPLADNGGLTKTMALLSGSPAIDAGASGGFSVDQRGTGYPRVVGSQADIGAFERGPQIFSDGFE